MIWAIFRLFPNYIELSMGRWLTILWFTTSKYDGWALIGAWAAIRKRYSKGFLFVCLVFSHGPLDLEILNFLKL